MTWDWVVMFFYLSYGTDFGASEDPRLKHVKTQGPSGSPICSSMHGFGVPQRATLGEAITRVYQSRVVRWCTAMFLRTMEMFHPSLFHGNRESFFWSCLNWWCSLSLSMKDFQAGRNGCEFRLKSAASVVTPPVPPVSPNLVGQNSPNRGTFRRRVLPQKETESRRTASDRWATGCRRCFGVRPRLLVANPSTISKFPSSAKDSVKNR